MLIDIALRLLFGAFRFLCIAFLSAISFAGPIGRAYLSALSWHSSTIFTISRAEAAIFAFSS
jgi:hypothetical protein